MGYVTEVKDQVRHPQIYPVASLKIKIESWAAVLMLFTGVLWVVLGLQHYRCYRGTTLQKDRSAYIFEWTKPGGLLQVVWHLWLQWCLDGQCLWLCGQQWVTVDRNLPIHLHGEALPAGRRQTFNYSNLPLTSGSVLFLTGHPTLLLRQQAGSSPYQRLQVHSQRRWAGSGWCCGICRSNHSRHWCRSFKLPVLQLRLTG